MLPLTNSKIIGINTMILPIVKPQSFSFLDYPLWFCVSFCVSLLSESISQIECAGEHSGINPYLVEVDSIAHSKYQLIVL